MPDITVVAWNVETFGDQWNATRGRNYSPICRFIGRVVRQLDTDIFFLMELRSNGGRYLNTLRTVLNGLSQGQGYTWQYDYVAGSVRDQQPYPITQPGQLGFTQAGHGEGYAVFWRSRPAAFTMRRTRTNLSLHQTNGNSYISLVFNGRTPTYDNNLQWFTAPNFNVNAPPAVWNRLDFPEPNPIHEGDIRWTRSRRPCYCVIDLNRGGGRAQQLLPIIVFHAPNSDFSTRFGVQACSYSTQVYQVDDTTQGAATMTSVNQAIVTGDFNLDWNQLGNNWRVDAYHTFTNGQAFGNNNNEGGAGLTNTWVSNNLNPAPNRTAVHLSDHNGNITTNNPNDYRWLAIDNLFYSNLNPVAAANYGGPVYNVLAQIIGDGFNFGDLVNTQPKRNVLQYFRQAILAEFNTGDYKFTDPNTNTPMRTRKRQRDDTYIYGGPIVSNLLNYNAYMNDLNNGYFTHARRAAEFYFNSVSDHLPVVFRFTI